MLKVVLFKFNQNSSIHQKILMEEDQIVEDVEASPLSESMQLQASPLSESSLLSESSPLSEAPTVVDLEASLQCELDTLWGNANEAENFTIFRTPHNISKSKKNLFEPSVISIGPFHRGKKHLRTLEEQKRRFLRDFLSRGDHISLDLCISEMKWLETRARRCYSESFDDLDRNAFVKMMLLDGCFILEYFAKRFEKKFSSIVEVGWNSDFVDHDLLLLENQIPFFIVEKLYEIGLNEEYRMPFLKFIARTFLFQILSEDCLHSIGIIPNPPAEIHHLIHLCYHHLVPHPDKSDILSAKSFDLTKMFSANRIIKGLPHWFRSRVPEIHTKDALPNSTGNLSWMMIPSATELKEAGLKFTPKNNPKHMLDISFEYGVLKIPKLEIADVTKPIFANLLAFEHSKYGKEHRPFGRFVEFLDNLVNTPNDVTILQNCGIVENLLGSEEEVTHFINHVTEGNMLMRNHYLTELYTEVNRYIGSSWNRHRAKFIRDYFSNPWAIISLIAALILLVLTLVQSFFAVFAYFRPPSP